MLSNQITQLNHIQKEYNLSPLINKRTKLVALSSSLFLTLSFTPLFANQFGFHPFFTTILTVGLGILAAPKFLKSFIQLEKSSSQILQNPELQKKLILHLEQIISTLKNIAEKHKQSSRPKQFSGPHPSRFENLPNHISRLELSFNSLIKSFLSESSSFEHISTLKHITEINSILNQFDIWVISKTLDSNEELPEHRPTKQQLLSNLIEENKRHLDRLTTLHLKEKEL